MRLLCFYSEKVRMYNGLHHVHLYQSPKVALHSCIWNIKKKLEINLYTLWGFFFFFFSIDGQLSHNLTLFDCYLAWTQIIVAAILSFGSGPVHTSPPIKPVFGFLVTRLLAWGTAEVDQVPQQWRQSPTFSRFDLFNHCRLLSAQTGLCQACHEWFRLSRPDQDLTQPCRTTAYLYTTHHFSPEPVFICFSTFGLLCVCHHLCFALGVQKIITDHSWANAFLGDWTLFSGYKS